MSKVEFKKFQQGIPKKYASFFDFSGGLNTTDPKHLIQNNELTDAKNVIIEGTALEKRKGTEQIGGTISGTTGKVRALHALNHYSGTSYFLSMIRDYQLYYLSSGTWTRIYSDGDDGLVNFVDYIDKAFFAISDGGCYLQHWDGENAVTDLDVTADHATETFTAASHGLEDYDFVKFAADTIPTGLSADTTYTVMNATTNTFQISTSYETPAVKAFSSNGSNVTVTEHAHIYTDMPVSGGTLNDTPGFLESFKERLIMANTSNYPYRVYYTNVGAATCGTNNYFDVDEPVTALKVYEDRLYIFTENRIYRVDGFVFNGASSEPERIYNLRLGTGCVSQKTIVNINKVLYFLGREDVYAFDGSRAYPIARPKIRKTFESLYQNRFEDSCAGTLKGRYYLGIKKQGENMNDTMLVFDTINKSWTYFNGLYPAAFVRYPNDAGEFELYFGDDDTSSGKVFKMNQGYVDAAPANVVTNSSFETGALGTVPTDWTEQYDSTTTGQVIKSADASILGDASVRLRRTGGDSWMQCYQQQTVTASTTYQFSFWIKTDYVSSTQDYYVHVLKNGGDYDMYTEFTFENEDNSEGRYYYGTVDIPAGVTNIQFGLVLNSDFDTSYVYWDDVRMQAIGGAISANIETKAYVLGTPHRVKKFNRLFISAESSANFGVDDTDYNLEVGISTGINTSFTTTQNLDLDDSTDIAEDYLNLSLKGKHARYKLSNAGANEPFKIYGITTEYTPKYYK